ncbi:hypothetical protein CAZ19_24790 [Pseudomonas aeruginosa]|uniref:Uncharacterized protein n=1 Tax=Pseudomonas aeruginosa TaxID=287 RepID=A0A367MA47_PSEAI|nr:hypothetical protein AM490_00335 [Pseudomonas aeruginosa]OPD74684.1 hypothetical protein AO910_33910 [Pseudomonas aeruginosa]OPD85329.1 hypothetical protein AO953_32650 [Pseudomonas aeruginosa]OPL29098.1 hypothetical protein B5L72_17875 [Pseudomonas aeruginosa]OTI20123.1 hypothetical protein CAZ07_22500 [Pseudomonas aeruginosa]
MTPGVIAHLSPHAMHRVIERQRDKISFEGRQDNRPLARFLFRKTDSSVFIRVLITAIGRPVHKIPKHAGKDNQYIPAELPARDEARRPK